MTYTPDQYETDFDRWLDSLTPAQREQITRDTEAARDLIDRERYPEPCDCTKQVARAAIAAAEPHIRAKIAAEIEAMDLSDQYGPLTAHGARADAARIARQEQP